MEVELQSPQYGSFENSKPLLFQRSYSPQPLSEVKYESLNEIHLDFSKANYYQGGKSIENNISSTTPLSINSKFAYKLKNNTSDPTLLTLTNNKNYLNSLRSSSANSSGTANSAGTFISNSLHINNTQPQPQISTNNNINTIDISTNSNIHNDISLKPKINKKNGPNVFIDTKFKKDMNSTFVSSANSTFIVNNPGSSSIVKSLDTPSTEATLDSPFLFKNNENTQTPSSSTPTPTSTTPKTISSSFSTINFFKSLLSPIAKKQSIDNNNNNNNNLDDKENELETPINELIPTIDTSFNSNTSFSNSNSNLININVTNKIGNSSNSLSHSNSNISLNSKLNSNSVSGTETSTPNTISTKSRFIQQKPNSINTNLYLSSYDSKTPITNFKSFQNFDYLKDQLEKSAKEQTLFMKNETVNNYSKEQIIHDQFSEQFKDEYNNINSSSFKKGSVYAFPMGKDDPFNPYNDSSFISNKDFNENSDPFLSPMNNEPGFDKVQEFNSHSNKNNKINWQLKTDSEKYISRLESKMNKIKKAPKEIVVEIPDYDVEEMDNYDYNSLLDEESEFLSDNENQPLIRRSETGTRVRRRKQIMHSIRDNKKLIISLFVLFLMALAGSIIFLF